MTSPDAACSPAVACFMRGFKNGSSVVNTKTEMESLIFSSKGPSPGIFSARPIYHRSHRQQNTDEELTDDDCDLFHDYVQYVNTCQRTACNSCGLMSSGRLPPCPCPPWALIRSTPCSSRSILPPWLSGSLNSSSRRALEEGPDRDCCNRALSSSAFKSTTEA